MHYTISEAGRRAGCPAVTIRYYERIGLLPQPARGTNGYRYYTGADVERLAFVVRARELGFGLSDIGELLALAAHHDQPCQAVDEKIAGQLAAVRERIEQLTALQARLERLQAACNGRHPIDQCGILAALSPEATTAGQ
ncbi:Mercuric resistance operon regulatory protein [wastewater metagenome]|uniref:Mercuric resistance operon regulatory protein n=2 Tax=unclassified sequences TaxID=12908 RepID=A0A5B8R5J6_9ZZZZ|nr:MULTISPECIES: MerR family transcriptional regulator [Arhodomonas]MCS4504640.1 MerR family DNA-binding protein [Arhodomonas aquaeolei]QEA04089.1 mercuric resistance operon regulatory protein [uncultured organism]